MAIRENPLQAPPQAPEKMPSAGTFGAGPARQVGAGLSVPKMPGFTPKNVAAGHIKLGGL